MLPLVKRVKLPENNFPTTWQTVIFRNYGFVSIDKIASVLRCEKSVVLDEAKRLGVNRRNVEALCSIHPLLQCLEDVVPISVIDIRNTVYSLLYE